MCGLKGVLLYLTNAGSIARAALSVSVLEESIGHTTSLTLVVVARHDDSVGDCRELSGEWMFVVVAKIEARKRAILGSKMIRP
jgi:hypothetical protein